SSRLEARLDGYRGRALSRSERRNLSPRPAHPASWWRGDRRRRVLLKPVRRVGDEPAISVGEAVAQLDFGLPAEAAHQAGIEQLARHAVGLVGRIAQPPF